MSKKVVIVGAGSIGSRHLQAIKKAKISIEIYVLDISKKSLKVAETRYKSIKKNDYVKKIIFTNKTSDLPQDIFLLVSATSASSRFNSTKSILDLCNVKNIIFEKFLFLKIIEYNKMSKLLKNKRINAWTNCNYQVIPFFKKNKYFNSDKLTMFVHGGDWAFASSAIHFIELFCYLTNNKISKMKFDLKNEQILPSKRNKYHEFGGLITAETQKGDTLLIESKKESKKPLYIDLSNNNFLFRLEVSKRTAHMTNFSNQNLFTKKFHIKFPFQSDLTNLYLKDIINKGDCGLPKYEDSSLNHKRLLQLFSREILRDNRYKSISDIQFT